MAAFYTLGHSTRSLEEFLEVLEAHRIETLADIRSFPMSRRLPHFNRESIEKSLAKVGIDYRWLKGLGGRRGSIRKDSPHVALRSSSFRNYADYMLTDEFENAMGKLISLGDHSRTALLCAERVYFHCHRMLVADWLVTHGHQVLHLEGTGAGKPHGLTAEARWIDGHVIYRGDRLL
ncbi:MAG TPA: DUF488 domain-containing protein [Terriglobales bacterium]|nr:DUF488 domain-containing protein [Terriglobales bacterium]